jgi:hypothetical protein
VPGDTIARDEPTYGLRAVPRRGGLVNAVAFGVLLVVTSPVIRRLMSGIH